MSPSRAEASGYERGPKFALAACLLLLSLLAGAAATPWVASGAVTVSFRVLAPVLEFTFVGVTSGAVYSAPVTPDARSSDPSVSFYATLNGEYFALGSTVFAEGVHTLAVTALNGSGDTVTRVVTFVIDYSSASVDITLDAAPDIRSIALSWKVTPEPAEQLSYRIVRATRLSDLPTASALAHTDATVHVDERISAGRRYYYRVVALGPGGVVVGESNIVSAVVDATVRRVWGADRLITAVETSRDTFDAADTVILATGTDFADALSAAGLAGSYRAPILLTNPSSLSARTHDEMKRLGASRIIIVGGPRAVDGSVETSLRRSGFTVMRIAGSDRYATAVAIAREIERNEARQGRARTSQIFLARGDEFPDALSVSPLAYALRAPVLLTTPNALPGVVESYVSGRGFRSVVVAGGTSAVSDAVAQRLARAGGVSIVRQGGSDRYTTSGAISSYGVDRGWASWAGVGIATGTNFPDALSGSVAVGELGGVLFVTPPDSLHPAARSRLSDNRDGVFDVRIFGGTRAVSGSVETTVRGIIP